MLLSMKEPAIHTIKQSTILDGEEQREQGDFSPEHNDMDLLPDEDEKDLAGGSKPEAMYEGFAIPSEAERYKTLDSLEPDSVFTPELLDDFKAFVRENITSVISTGEYDIGHLKTDMNLDLDIEFEENAQISCKPYKLDVVREQQLQKGLEQLEKINFLKEGESPYVSPVFITSKGRGKSGARLCRIVFDYRRFNAATMPFKWPLANIDVLLTKLKNNDFYSCIDIRAAYWCVRLSEATAKKAAIITSSKIYIPQVMPFGLKQAPSHFSKIMHHVLGDMENTLFYLDDIIIFSKGSKQKHLDCLKKVLTRLHAVNLKINVAKCDFFKRELKFLGKILSSEGTRPLPSHVKTLKEYPEPTDKKSLQRFLGLVNWLGGYIPHYSQKN